MLISFKRALAFAITLLVSSLAFANNQCHLGGNATGLDDEAHFLYLKTQEIKFKGQKVEFQMIRSDGSITVIRGERFKIYQYEGKEYYSLDIGDKLIDIVPSKIKSVEAAPPGAGNLGIVDNIPAPKDAMSKSALEQAAKTNKGKRVAVVTTDGNVYIGELEQIKGGDNFIVVQNSKNVIGSKVLKASEVAHTSTPRLHFSKKAARLQANEDVVTVVSDAGHDTGKILGFDGDHIVIQKGDLTTVKVDVNTITKMEHASADEAAKFAKARKEATAAKNGLVGKYDGNKQIKYDQKNTVSGEIDSAAKNHKEDRDFAFLTHNGEKISVVGPEAYVTYGSPPVYGKVSRLWIDKDNQLHVEILELVEGGGFKSRKLSKAEFDTLKSAATDPKAMEAFRAYETDMILPEMYLPHNGQKISSQGDLAFVSYGDPAKPTHAKVSRIWTDQDGHLHIEVIDAPVDGKFKDELLIKRELNPDEIESMRLNADAKKPFNDYEVFWKKQPNREKHVHTLAESRYEREIPPMSMVDTLIGGEAARGTDHVFIYDDEILAIHKPTSSKTFKVQGYYGSGTEKFTVSYGKNGRAILQQQAQRGCTAATAEMLAVDAGLAPDLQHMRTTNLGNDASIISHLEKRGLKVKYRKGNSIELLAKRLETDGPASISVGGELMGHEIIVDSIDLAKKTATIRDPWHGWQITITLDAFIKRAGKSIDTIQVVK